MISRIKLFTKNNPVLISIILLISLCLIFYHPLIFQQKMYASQDWGRGDLTHFNYPLRNIYGNTIKHFSLPLWTPLIYSGFPLAAEGQIGMFFLSNLLLFFLFSNMTAFSLSYLILSISSATGTYLYCRKLQLGNLPAIFSAVTFSFGMFYAGHFMHINMIQAFSLLPWFFFLIHKVIVEKISVLSFILLCFLQSQMFFTGYPQVALYTYCAILLYTTLYSPKENMFRNIVFVLAIGTIGTLLSAIQLLPTYELSKISPSLKYESALESMTFAPFTLRDWAYFVSPFPYGDPSKGTYSILLKDGIFWENNIYSGIIAFLFFLIALLKIKKNNIIRSSSILFLTFLLFSMGWIYIFYYIPPFSYFRMPQRALVISLFFFSVVSGFGLQNITYFLKRYWKIKIILPLCVMVILIQAFDLIRLANTFNNPISVKDWLQPPPTAQFLQTHNDGRIYSIGGVQLWEHVYNTITHGWEGDNARLLLSTKAVLDPNRTAAFGDIASFEGYAKLVPLRPLAYASLIRKGVKYEDTPDIRIASSSAKLLGYQSVKYIVTAKPVTGNYLEELFSYPDKETKITYRIYKNPYALPPIRAVEQVFPLTATRVVTIDDLIPPDKQWQKLAFTEKNYSSGTYNPNLKIFNHKINTQQIDFDVETNNGKGFVVIAQSYDPEWKAFIDGKNTEVLAANINLQGIIVPQGKHHVTMKFIPQAYIKGAIISFSGIILMVFISVVIRYRPELKIPTIVKRK